MKKLIILCVLCLCIQNVFSQKCMTYRVNKIESTDNYYFISVERKSNFFLIVSEKKDNLLKNNNKLSLGKKYKMILNDYRPPKSISNIMNYVYSIEGRAIWSTNGKYKSYTTNNLNGLNYKPR